MSLLVNMCAQESFKKADKDGDGALTFVEVLKAIMRQIDGDFVSRAKAEFSKLDRGAHVHTDRGRYISLDRVQRHPPLETTERHRREEKARLSTCHDATNRHS